MIVPKIPLPTKRRPNTPGEILVEEFLKPLAISQTKFAKHIGISYVRLNEIVNGRRAVTPDTAMRFAQALGMTTEFWLGLQQDIELWDVHHSAAAKEIAKIKPIAEVVAAS